MGPIIYVDQSRINQGQLHALQAGMRDLVAFVRANEPELIAYTVYFSEDGTRMTVIHIHEEPATLEWHLEVAGPEFPKVAPFIELEAIDIYGNPGHDLVERLRDKAEMLGSGVVRLHAFHDGVARISV